LKFVGVILTKTGARACGRRRREGVLRDGGNADRPFRRRGQRITGKEILVREEFVATGGKRSEGKRIQLTTAGGN